MDIPEDSPIQKEDVTCVCLFEGFSGTGEAFYAYIAVRADLMEAFGEAMKSKKPVDLTRFGEVLMHGMGRPTDEVKQFMEDEYGFDHSSQMKADLSLLAPDDNESA